MTLKLRLAVATLLMLSANAAALSQSKPSQPTEQSCRQFVQGFYDWYVPRVSQTNDWFESALKKRDSFSDALFLQLREDANAQKKAEELVGLDFDPFLNSQDSPSKRLLVIKVKVKGSYCEAAVQGISAGVTREEVQPVLHWGASSWKFTNFRYGNKRDLLTLLKLLREDRERSAKAVR